MGQGNLLTGWMMLLSDWRAGLLQPNHRSLHIFHALAVQGRNASIHSLLTTFTVVQRGESS
jgi:hypothetical protein